MSERMRFDAPRLSRDEATELCVYHLRMAAALFQLVPDDGNASLIAEIERQAHGDLHEVDVQPALAWAASILFAYDKMKQGDY